MMVSTRTYAAPWLCVDARRGAWAWRLDAGTITTTGACERTASGDWIPHAPVVVYSGICEARPLSAGRPSAADIHTDRSNQAAARRRRSARTLRSARRSRTRLQIWAATTAVARVARVLTPKNHPLWVVVFGQCWHSRGGSERCSSRLRSASVRPVESPGKRVAPASEVCADTDTDGGLLGVGLRYSSPLHTHLSPRKSKVRTRDHSPNSTDEPRRTSPRFGAKRACGRAVCTLHSLTHYTRTTHQRPVVLASTSARTPGWALEQQRSPSNPTEALVKQGQGSVCHYRLMKP